MVAGVLPASDRPARRWGRTPNDRVLELAADGLDGPLIAGELVLGAATVRTRFARIYRKLGVPDRAAAVAKAMRLGPGPLRSAAGTRRFSPSVRPMMSR